MLPSYVLKMYVSEKLFCSINIKKTLDEFFDKTFIKNVYQITNFSIKRCLMKLPSDQLKVEVEKVMGPQKLKTTNLFHSFPFFHKENLWSRNR